MTDQLSKGGGSRKYHDTCSTVDRHPHTLIETLLSSETYSSQGRLKESRFDPGRRLIKMMMMLLLKHPWRKMHQIPEMRRAVISQKAWHSTLSTLPYRLIAWSAQKSFIHSFPAADLSPSNQNFLNSNPSIASSEKCFLSPLMKTLEDRSSGISSSRDTLLFMIPLYSHFPILMSHLS